MSAARTAGTLGCPQLEALWESAGGSPAAAFTAAEIATAESSGRQYATLYDGNGTVDRGYFQINSIWGPLSTYSAYGNARAAVHHLPRRHRLEPVGHLADRRLRREVLTKGESPQ